MRTVLTNSFLTISFFTMISLFSGLALPKQCYADAYSWIDKNGNRVYGTKPPKGAGSVSTLKTRTLSRYSSTKVLQRMGHNESAVAASNSGSTPSGGENSGSPAQSSSGATDISFVAAELKAESPKIIVNDDKKIIACTVTVANLNEFTAGEISVAFEFEDGSLIPAVGPSELLSKNSADYAIPEDFLPLKLEADAPDPKAQPPKVIVHGFKR
jgi:hypothetical protein